MTGHRGLTKKQAEDLVAKWNKVPQGTRVVVRRDDRSETHTKIRSKAWLVGGVPVILVDGISGAYALERISLGIRFLDAHAGSRNPAELTCDDEAESGGAVFVQDAPAIQPGERRPRWHQRRLRYVCEDFQLLESDGGNGRAQRLVREGIDARAQRPADGGDCGEQLESTEFRGSEKRGMNDKRKR